MFMSNSGTTLSGLAARTMSQLLMAGWKSTLRKNSDLKRSR